VSFVAVVYFHWHLKKMASNALLWKLLLSEVTVDYIDKYGLALGVKKSFIYL